MKVISTEKWPIKMWLDDIEDGALAQAKNLANLPFLFKHVALMPDTHQGYGMPIGDVMATRGYIIPNAVGVDIGCGMCAIKTSLTNINVDILKEAMGRIREAVPVGFAHQKERQDIHLMPRAGVAGAPQLHIVKQQYESALRQIGTLGGGNHFIEIQKGDDGYIWIMIHSGSRNLGYKVAKHYNKLAIELNQKYYSQVPKEWELAFLPIGTKEARNYIEEMKYCVAFALANRKLMMDTVTSIFFEIYGADILFDEMINIAHNYVVQENHFSENVWVHRKGATLASEGTIGIIPGSQGTSSYIVEGLGNPASFNSCSHGAGRKMGRKQAKRELELDDVVNKLNAKGILHSIRGVDDLDEAPEAYKDINVVMNNQRDLVKVKVKLTPLAVIKG